jgi:large subunit ribosomal protein L19
MNTLEKFEKRQINDLIKDKDHPKFFPGDTIKIHLKIKEGEKERIQVFEGICISKKNSVKICTLKVLKHRTEE